MTDTLPGEFDYLNKSVKEYSQAINRLVKAFIEFKAKLQPDKMRRLEKYTRRYNRRGAKRK